MKKLLIYLLVLVSPVAAQAAVTQLNALSWARADGTDQTVNMQRAVNAAATAGQSLFVPPGIVYTAASLTNTANVLIEDYTDLGQKILRGALEIVSPPLVATTNYFGNTNVTQLAYGLAYLGTVIDRGNVLWYGADPTGATDSTTAINTAIAAVSTNGGTVYFPSGTYVISSPINITENKELTLTGESTVNSLQPLSGSILTLADGANCDMLVKSTTGRVNIKGLVFDGNKAGQTVTNLHGIWFQGTNTMIRRATLEDVIVWEISGVGIQVDSLESHVRNVHVGYCEGDGINITASSDTDWWNVLSGFNAGNGVAFVGVPGMGAGGCIFTFGNIYRNGLNGLYLSNAFNSTFIHCVTDANTMNGILGEGPGWRNRFFSCNSHVNNYPSDNDGVATTYPSGTYSNVKLAGDSSSLYDWEFIGCSFFQYESTLTHKPKYLIEDARTAFAATKYARLSFNSCNFADGFAVTGPYDATSMVANASGEWKLDGVPSYNRNRLYSDLRTEDLRVIDQAELDVGVLANAYYSSGWLYRSNGPAFYMAGRYDDPIFRIQYAGTGTAGDSLAWTNGLTLNSTNGYVGINTGATPAVKRFEVAGSAKVDDLEIGNAISANAYYSSGWKRRAADTAFLLQTDVDDGGGNTNAVFYIAPTDAADSEITWTPFLKATTAGDVIDRSNVKWWGAKGDGATDDYSSLTNAIATAATAKQALYIPAGTYLISKTIELPSYVCIYGDPSDMGYRGSIPRRSVIKTATNISAFQTPRLTAPNNMLAYWVHHIVLKDLYIEGTQYQASPYSNSVGLDISGCYASVFDNMHVEGFGTGFMFWNVADIVVNDPLSQNNFYGAVVRRDPAAGSLYYDCVLTFNDFININNQVCLLLDNPRHVGFFGGNIISNWTNSSPTQITNVIADSQIIFHGLFAMENHSYGPHISVDGHGLGNLTVQNCNLETANFNQPYIETEGYFDNITFVDNSIERRTGTNKCAPVVWAKRPSSDVNTYLQRNAVTVHGNTPAWFDTFVRNDQLMSRPENDHVPPGYIPLNPLPAGSAGVGGADGVVQIAGDYAFTRDSIGTLGKVYWQTTDANNAYLLLTDTNLTKGITHIYVTAVLYDNEEANVPILNVFGWGVQGDWYRISQSKIGSYTNPTTGVAFSKWAWCMIASDQAEATNGLSSIQLIGFYGTAAANRSDYGLESVRAYALAAENPYGPRFQTASTSPTTGLEGLAYRGKILWNDYSSTSNVVGWIAKQDTWIADWNTIGNVYSPPSQTQYEFPFLSAATGGALGASGVYGSAATGQMALGTTTHIGTRMTLADTSGATAALWIGKTTNASVPFIMLSDTVDYASYIGMDTTNNFTWLGSNNSHFRLNLDGSISVGTLAADPTTPTDGSVWYNSTEHEFRGRTNGVTVIFSVTPAP